MQSIRPRAARTPFTAAACRATPLASWVRLPAQRGCLRAGPPSACARMRGYRRRSRATRCAFILNLIRARESGRRAELASVAWPPNAYGRSRCRSRDSSARLRPGSAPAPRRRSRGRWRGRCRSGCSVRSRSALPPIGAWGRGRRLSPWLSRWAGFDTQRRRARATHGCRRCSFPAVAATLHRTPKRSRCEPRCGDHKPPRPPSGCRRSSIPPHPTTALLQPVTARHSPLAPAFGV